MTTIPDPITRTYLTTLPPLLVARWATDVAEHVLGQYERQFPDDPRPRRAIETARAWLRGELAASGPWSAYPCVEEAEVAADEAWWAYLEDRTDEASDASAAADISAAAALAAWYIVWGDDVPNAVEEIASIARDQWTWQREHLAELLTESVAS